MANKGLKLERITQSDINDIVRMIDEKKPYKIIADFIGCSYATISNVARKTGQTKYLKTTREQINKVMEIHEYVPVTEIASITGLNVRIVCGIIARNKKYRNEK